MIRLRLKDVNEEMTLFYLFFNGREATADDNMQEVTERTDDEEHVSAASSPT